MTQDQLKQRILSSKIAGIDVRECSICDANIGYVFLKGEPYFDSNCDCTQYRSACQRRDWEDVYASYMGDTEYWEQILALYKA